MMIERPTHARTNKFHAPDRQKAKSVLRTQNETINKAVPRRERLISNGYPKTKFTMVLIWKGRDNVKYFLPVLTGHYRERFRNLTLVRILTLHRLLLIFPGSHLQVPE